MFEFGATNNKFSIGITKGSVCDFITKRRLDVPYIFFDTVTGKAHQDIKKSFATALRRAGIKDFRLHDPRHTFASHLVMAGVHITTVSRLLGHKSLTMTLRYAHLAPAHMTKAVNILDSALNETSTSHSLHNTTKKGLSINA